MPATFLPVGIYESAIHRSFPRRDVPEKPVTIEVLAPGSTGCPLASNLPNASVMNIERVAGERPAGTTERPGWSLGAAR